jgi:hypothetical protein
LDEKQGPRTIWVMRSGLGSFLRDAKWEGARFALMWLAVSVAVALALGKDVSTIALAGIIFGLAIAVGVYLVRTENRS